MNFDLFSFLLFLLLGMSAGFLSGLIGIGGGFVLVPGLFYAFVHMGLSPGNELPLVMGTTMACMIFTSLTSVRSHKNTGVIRGDVVKRFTVWIAAGTVAGAVMASLLDASYVKAGFAAFCLYSAARMLFFASKTPLPVDDISNSSLKVPGVFFGVVCGLIGVGGANLFVPFMMKRGLDIRQAMATASALQIPIAIVGTVAYVGMGLAAGSPARSLGYVYIPALIVVAGASMAMAPLGVRTAHRMPVNLLKKTFGVFTAVIGLKMASFFTFVWSLFSITV